MNRFAEGLGILLIASIIIGAGALLGGTILWLIWEDSVTAMFPKAVESGVLAATLGWWQSVKIVWVFGLLIKATQTNNNK